MAVVAERRGLGALAGAEHHRAVARRLPFQRLEAMALVRAVAERLALRAPATAPPVGFASDHVDNDRLAPAEFGLTGHRPLQLRSRAMPPRRPWRVRAPAEYSSAAR